MMERKYIVKSLEEKLAIHNPLDLSADAIAARKRVHARIQTGGRSGGGSVNSRNGGGNRRKKAVIEGTLKPGVHVSVHYGVHYGGKVYYGVIRECEGDGMFAIAFTTGNRTYVESQIGL